MDLQLKQDIETSINVAAAASNPTLEDMETQLNNSVVCANLPSSVPDAITNPCDPLPYATQLMAHNCDPET